MRKSKLALTVLGSIVVFWFAWGTGQRVGATLAKMPPFHELYTNTVNVHQDSKGKGPFESLVCVTPIVDIPGASIKFSWSETIEIQEAPKPFHGTLPKGKCTKWLIKGVVKGPVDIGEGRKIRALIRMHIEFPYPHQSVSDHIMNHYEDSQKLWGQLPQEMLIDFLQDYKGLVMKNTKTWSP